MTKEQLKGKLDKTTQLQRDLLECVILGTDGYSRENYDMNELQDLGLVDFRYNITESAIKGKGHWYYTGGEISAFFALMEEANWA